MALRQWVADTRRCLGLPTDRPVIATGHQTLLWHPGILAKYLLVAELAGDRGRYAAANLIVDQHTDHFADFEIPVRRDVDGALRLETITLTTPLPEVPMCRHPAFVPSSRAVIADAALPSVRAGAQGILDAVAAHRDLDNAALQMAAALDDLMARWVAPIPGVCASSLMRTPLAAALLEEMADDPRRCAACYNAAVERFPEARIPRLDTDRTPVELPLWKLGPDQRRRHADESDLRRSLGGDGATLLPRALFLTLLVRTGLCDLFVHGTGGANYDRVMEHWLESWLRLRPCPIAVATATLRLPLAPDGDPAPDAGALGAWHRAWHDPQGAAAGVAPGPAKSEILAKIAAAPRRSADRRRLFREMHERLDRMRQQHADAIERARSLTDHARSAIAERSIRERRSWPFPLYPQAMIDELKEEVRRSLES